MKKLLALFFLAGSLQFPCSAQQADVATRLGYPQTILYNSRIVTMDDPSFDSRVGTIVEALAIRDGRILDIGSNEEILALAGPETRQIDLAGRMVLPGFILTHEHPHEWMFTEPRGWRHVFPNDEQFVSRWLPNVDPGQQLAMFEGVFQEAVAKAKPGQWVRVVFNWGPDYEWATTLPRMFRTAVTKQRLDELAPNNPACVSEGFTAACIFNSKALEEYLRFHSDLDFYETGGQGGGVVIEENQKRIAQTGNIGRIAGDAIFGDKIPQLADLLKAQLELWASFGVTAHSSAPYTFSNHQALHLLDKEGRLPVRFAWGYHGPAWDLETLRVLAATQEHGTEYLWLIGAWGDTGGPCMTVPSIPEWQRATGQSGPERCDLSPGEVGREVLERIVESGFRIATMHTGGDQDIDYMLDAIEAGSKRAGFSPEEIRAKRHAFDHAAGAPRPDQIPRMKRLGMLVSMINTILWEVHRGASVTAKRYGIEYADWVVPRKRVNDAEIMHGFEIDRPLPHKLFFFLLKGMNRYNDWDGVVYGPAQRTDRITQLKSLTRWGSYYLLREDRLGTLEAGKLADFIVLDRDFLAIPEAEIPQTKVLMTAVGGKIVHLVAELGEEIGIPAVGASTWPEPIPTGWEPKPY